MIWPLLISLARLPGIPSPEGLPRLEGTIPHQGFPALLNPGLLVAPLEPPEEALGQLPALSHELQVLVAGQAL